MKITHIGCASNSRRKRLLWQEKLLQQQRKQLRQRLLLQRKLPQQKELEKDVEKVAAETKAVAEKVAKKATTRKTAPKATVTVEAAGRQFDITAIADKAVAAYKAMNEKAAVKTVDVYVKPEEGVAYYVINGEGSADFKVEL